jgi:hypothetical protein
MMSMPPGPPTIVAGAPAEPAGCARYRLGIVSRTVGV